MTRPDIAHAVAHFRSCLAEAEAALTVFDDRSNEPQMRDILGFIANTPDPEGMPPDHPLAGLMGQMMASAFQMMAERVRAMRTALGPLCKRLEEYAATLPEEAMPCPADPASTTASGSSSPAG
jgi:hypothetical protein